MFINMHNGNKPLRINKSLNFFARSKGGFCDKLFAFFPSLTLATDWKISFCLSTLRFNSTFDTLIFWFSPKKKTKRKTIPPFPFSNSQFTVPGGFSILWVLFHQLDENEKRKPQMETQKKLSLFVNYNFLLRQYFFLSFSCMEKMERTANGHHK